MYYGLFVCINLVDVMPLFFTIFSFNLPIFDKNHPVSIKIRPKIITSIFWTKPTDLSVKPTAFPSFQFSLLLRRSRVFLPPIFRALLRNCVSVCLFGTSYARGHQGAVVRMSNATAGNTW
jgi:hypothetical protein